MVKITNLIHVFIPTKKNCFRPHAFRHKLLGLYSLGLLLSQLVLGVSFYSGPSMVNENIETMKANIINLTNKERTKNELGELSESKVLNKAAEDKLTDMFQNNYWDHTSPIGKMPWDFMKQENYSYIYAGENLAKGFVDSTSTVEAWMDSPSHKDNLLSSRYKEIGVAIGNGKINGKPTTLVVQMFGSPQTQIAGSPTKAEAAPLVLGVKEQNIKINPFYATVWGRIPYFIMWLVIFTLIVFDGAMLRRCGLHTSKKHMFEFRSALLINVIVFIILCLNFVAIA
jgi:uncharacterized protein YkwD